MGKQFKNSVKAVLFPNITAVLKPESKCFSKYWLKVNTMINLNLSKKN